MIQLGKYRIVYMEHAGEKYTNYVCRRPDSSKLYLAVVLPESGFLEYLIPYVQSGNIQDFIEYFPVRTGFCMIFSHTPGTPLDEIPADERARLLKPFLETLIHKNLPCEYISGILSSGRVLLSKSGDIHFIYAPPDLSVPLTDADICRKTALFLENLWPSPPDESGVIWLSRLKNGEYLNLCDAYGHMPEPAAQLEFPEKHVSKLTAFIERLPGIAAAVLAGIALITAAYMYFAAPSDKPQPGSIKILGDIVIPEE